MKEIKSFYIWTFFVVLITFCFLGLGYNVYKARYQNSHADTGVFDTEYGAFLASQHALYVNDFESASKMVSLVKADNKTVQRLKNVSDFFNGKMPQNAALLKDSKDLMDGLIYDAYLINQNDWKAVYGRHSKDATIFAAPFRIFSAAASGKAKEVDKFINSLKTNDYWKSFIRGQIAVLNNDIDGAAKEFAKVHPEFMNINDYLYLMSFYKENNMVEDMKILQDDFLATPGGVSVSNYLDIPDWSNYSGYKNNLVFSIIQTVSHTQIMLYTDLSLMFLRFAQVISDESNTDALNYYLGQYYFYNYGDYEACFKKINKKSPFYLLSRLNLYEKDKDLKAVKKIVKNNPLFIPAIKIVVKDSIKNGDKSGVLSVLNRALKQKQLSDENTMFFLKQRAYVNFMFGNLSKAQQDLQKIKEINILPTSDILLLQAKIWEKQGRNLDDAYDYAMSVIKNNTSDVYAWDILARVVARTEGIANALEIMESVGATGTPISLIYDNLGDLYLKQGDKEKAKRAYGQALDLSDDGLVVVPELKKKIRNLK